MAATKESTRKSVSLPSRLVKRIMSLAKTERRSAHRVLVDLIETGIKEREKERFLTLAGRLVESTSPQEKEGIREELARLAFGE
jgi:metal-responsive CopG/Arc/MetJ family transcriptional regulator